MSLFYIMKNITKYIPSFLLVFSPLVIFYLIWFFPLQKQELISDISASFFLVILFSSLKWHISKKKIFAFSLLTATTYLAYTVRLLWIDYNLGRFDINADSLWLWYMQALIEAFAMLIVIYLLLKVLSKDRK